MALRISSPLVARLLAPLALAFPAAAQLGFTWGPEAAPMGCPVYYSLQNGTANPVNYDPCGFAVFDAAGNVIYSPPCAGSVVIQPGTAYSIIWLQSDLSGLQVPPGVYHLNDPAGPAITVGGAQAGVAPIGTRDFLLCSPQDAGKPYFMGAMLSSTNPGFTLCGQAVPIPFESFTLTWNDPAVFQGFVGFLDASGRASAHIAPPPGFTQTAQVDYAFVVFDFTQPCPVRRASARTRTLFF